MLESTRGASIYTKEQYLRRDHSSSGGSGERYKDLSCSARSEFGTTGKGQTQLVSFSVYSKVHSALCVLRPSRCSVLRKKFYLRRYKIKPILFFTPEIKIFFQIIENRPR